MRKLPAVIAAAALVLSACSAAPEGDPGVETHPAESSSSDTATHEFTTTEHGRFDEPWALEFLPGTDYLVVSERVGALQLVDVTTDDAREITGAPEVLHDGQAGMHDIVAGPTFEQDGTVYLSWVREAPEGAQGVVARATLDTETAELTDLEEIWEQTPTSGTGHFSLRMLIGGDYLYLTSGDRQKFDPAQETETNLGKVLRLDLDGNPAEGNPFAGEGESSDEIFTMGHRNPLGIARDADGAVWVSEMGPKGGDELNLLVAGENYGWPEASMGVHYDGGEIPDHAEGDGYVAPAEYWVPSISPGSLMIYSGDLFSEWTGDAFLGGLSGQRIVRVELDGDTAAQAEEWDMGERIRAVEEGPDGAIWIAEDGSGGRLLELRPK